jgi:hypothetical protein
MNTVTAENNGGFVGKWELDGNQLKKDGVTIAVFNPEADRKVASQILEFCQVGKCVHIRNFGDNQPPMVFVTVDSDALREYSSIPATVCSVQVTRGRDRKIGRASLSIGTPGNDKVNALMTVPRNQDNVSRDARVVFVDYSKPKD